MKKRILLLGAAGVILAVSGCGHRDSGPGSTASNVPAPQTPVSPQSPSASPAAPVTTAPTASPESAPKAAAPGQAVIYTLNGTQGNYADDYLVPEKVSLSNPVDPARETIQALLTAKGTPIAKGTQLNGVRISHGVAVIDFSQSPVDETQGEDKQSQALESLQMTMGQFPSVKKIWLTVDGKPQSSFGEAAGGPMKVIRPGETLQGMGGA